jgi:Divergent InlB B-repeat domain
VGISVKGARRFAAAVVGALVAAGFVAASAPSRSTQDGVELQLTTAGLGTLAVLAQNGGDPSFCRIEGQLTTDSGPDCDLTFEAGTAVTLQAIPDDDASFDGWGDFECGDTSVCTITLDEGPRFVTALFSPVTISVLTNDKFGRITVTPKPENDCELVGETACQYPRGTTVTLHRQHGALGGFWIGACKGNKQGRLKARVCRLKLTSDEVVGAGYATVGDIPPAIGTGIAVVVSGSGKVTGHVINKKKKLNCPSNCIISGLKRYDYVYLHASGSNFSGWSNGSTARTQPAVPMASVNRIKAIFG